MTKKQVRDGAAHMILKVELGAYKFKSTGETLTLDKFPETKMFGGLKEKLAEKKISRRSVFSTVEMMLFCLELTEHKDSLHKFCYTHLDK